MSNLCCFLKVQYRHFQHGMESMSYFKMNTVTGNYWLIYAVATVIIIIITCTYMTLSCGVLFSVTELSKTSTLIIPCPVDRANTSPVFN